MQRPQWRAARRSPTRLLLGLLFAAMLAMLSGSAFASGSATADKSAARTIDWGGSARAHVGRAGRPGVANRAALNLVEEADLVQPDEEPDRSAYIVGFTNFAEGFNGRAAMLGFFALIFLEFFTNKTFFALLGQITG
mmetsp:Transcript_11271/g.30688  ORF Transcript_11271/g.30688 Transcript_11271/m.30688 type:complete len:137 (-) Transcript_11271:102-512(-)